MPDAYEVHDGQFIQLAANGSVANALSIQLPAVPSGKVWTFLSAFLTVNVAETQDFWFSISSMGFAFPVTIPVQFALAPAVGENFPLVREGMELKLWQGEQLFANRSAATAGSSITVIARYIETDMAFYREADKYKELRRKTGGPLQFWRSRAVASTPAGGRRPVGREISGPVAAASRLKRPAK